MGLDDSSGLRLTVGMGRCSEDGADVVSQYGEDLE